MIQDGKILKFTDSKRISYHTSKGNQLKFYDEDNKLWYKLDDFGYESLAEVVSYQIAKYIGLLNYIDFVEYSLCKIEYNYSIKVGCVSKTFYDSSSFIEYTIHRLFEVYNNIDIYKKLDTISDTKDKIKYLVDGVISITGINEFGNYLSRVLQFDRLVLNEDRHLFNLVVLYNDYLNKFVLSPVFDNGLSLLSDLIDYPIRMLMITAIRKVKSKPFSTRFSKQVNVIIEMYDNELIVGNSIDLDLSYFKDYYDRFIIDRVVSIIKYQFKLLYNCDINLLL